MRSGINKWSDGDRSTSTLSRVCRNLVYDELIRTLGNRCDMCGMDGVLYIDHDHETMEIRGIVCHTCNTKIRSGTTSWSASRVNQYFQLVRHRKLLFKVIVENVQMDSL